MKRQRRCLSIELIGLHDKMYSIEELSAITKIVGKPISFPNFSVFKLERNTNMDDFDLMIYKRIPVDTTRNRNELMFIAWVDSN